MPGTSYINYERWASDTNNGETPYGQLAKEFDLQTSFANRLPLRVATGLEGDKFMDHGKFKSNWELNRSSRPMSPDDLYLGGESGTYDRTDIMGMRGGGCYVYRHEHDMNPSALAQYRIDKAKEAMADTALDVEHSLLWGDPTAGISNGIDNTKDCLGLFPRFSVITDRNAVITSGTNINKIASYVTLDAGGTGNDLTSVLLMVPDARMGVTRLMAENTGFTGSIRWTPGTKWDEYDGTDPLTGRTGFQYVTRDSYDIVYGIAIMNRFSCIAIRNIDWQTDNGIKAFISQYRQAKAALDKRLIRKTPMLLMNDDLDIAVSQYYENIRYSNINTIAEGKNNTIGEHCNLPGSETVICPHIISSESQITNS